MNFSWTFSAELAGSVETSTQACRPDQTLLFTIVVFVQMFIDPGLRFYFYFTDYVNIILLFMLEYYFIYINVRALSQCDKANVRFSPNILFRSTGSDTALEKFAPLHLQRFAAFRVLCFVTSAQRSAFTWHRAELLSFFPPTHPFIRITR